jgi:hypothetical protein
VPFCHLVDLLGLLVVYGAWLSVIIVYVEQVESVMVIQAALVKLAISLATFFFVKNVFNVPSSLVPLVQKGKG